MACRTYLLHRLRTKGTRRAFLLQYTPQDAGQAPPRSGPRLRVELFRRGESGAGREYFHRLSLQREFPSFLDAMTGLAYSMVRASA